MELAAIETGDGPPIVVLHGLFGSARNWNMIAKRLGATRRVHALDLRNHGGSPWGEEMDYPSMAGDVAAYIEARGLGPCPVLGHSMGGKAAMWLALSRPGLVSALIAADIAPVAYGQSLLAYVRKMRSLDLSGMTRRAEAEAALADAVPEAGVRSFLMQNLVAEGGELRWRINLPVIEAHFDDITGFPDTKASYDGPALFLDGERSDYIKPAHEPAIRRHFPKARIETIRDAGHWLHADQPDAVFQAIRAFLGD